MELKITVSIVLVVSLIFNYFMIKRSIKASKKNKELKEQMEKNKKVVEKIEKVEKEKEEIREKYSDKEAEVLSGDSSSDIILPNNTKPKHNHAFGEPCTKDCPAYTK